MESKKSNSRISTRGIEENTLAILDSSGVKDARDVLDDRLSFLEAVRAVSIVPEDGTPPTSKMFEAIFQILNDSTSLELVMESYQLLSELDKRFPRVYLSHIDTSKSSCNHSLELVVVEEAWSPFAIGSESTYNGRNATSRNSGSPLDSFGFFLLIQNIAQEFDKTNCQLSDMKHLGNMLLFQYIVNVLEQDFLPRKTLYKEITKWSLLRESFLSMLLGSRRISYKNLVKECLSILTKRSTHKHNVSLSASLIELQKGTCASVQKFMILIMELDKAKKEADAQGVTSRADGARTSLVEIILDELTYDEDLVYQFLKVFSEPLWKLEIIVQYCWKYLAKPSTRTRRSSSNSSDDVTFLGVLKCFSSDTSTKSVIKKIGIEVAQLLLAHAFQAYIYLQRHAKHPDESSNDIGGSQRLQICKDLISAFKNLKRTDKHMSIIPFGKQALITATTILSTT